MDNTTTSTINIETGITFVDEQDKLYIMLKYGISAEGMKIRDYRKMMESLPEDFDPSYYYDTSSDRRGRARLTKNGWMASSPQFASELSVALLNYEKKHGFKRTEDLPNTQIPKPKRTDNDSGQTT